MNDPFDTLRGELVQRLRARGARRTATPLGMVASPVPSRRGGDRGAGGVRQRAAAAASR